MRPETIIEGGGAEAVRLYQLVVMQRDWAENHCRALWNDRPRIAIFCASFGVMVGVALSVLAHWVLWR